MSYYDNIVERILNMTHEEKEAEFKRLCAGFNKNKRTRLIFNLAMNMFDEEDRRMGRPLTSEMFPKIPI